MILNKLQLVKKIERIEKRGDVGRGSRFGDNPIKSKNAMHEKFCDIRKKR